MAKGIYKGEVPPNDPRFGRLSTHSHAVWRRPKKTMADAGAPPRRNHFLRLLTAAEGSGRFEAVPPN